MQSSTQVYIPAAQISNTTDQLYFTIIALFVETLSLMNSCELIHYHWLNACILCAGILMIGLSNFALLKSKANKN
jgi:hypothetical protein